MVIDWKAVKKDFESGGLSLSAMADKYGCHKDSVRRKAKKEGWTRGQPAEQASQAGKSERCLPERHRNFWRGVEKRLAKGLKTKDVKQGLEELKVAKTAADVISSIIRSKRLELGLDEGSTENGADDNGAITAEMARVTISSGAEKALD